jgi:hypothetical protein
MPHFCTNSLPEGGNFKNPKIPTRQWAHSSNLGLLTVITRDEKCCVWCELHVLCERFGLHHVTCGSIRTFYSLRKIGTCYFTLAMGTNLFQNVGLPTYGRVNHAPFIIMSDEHHLLSFCDSRRKKSDLLRTISGGPVVKRP